MSLRQRQFGEPEVIDALDLCPVKHTGALRGLARLISVRAAYTPDEALNLAARAGFHGATVRCRWLLAWEKPT